MAAKIKFTATFENGDTLTRTSATGTNFAWRVENSEGVVVGKGWASSRDLAEKASTVVIHSESGLRVIGEYHTAKRKGYLKLCIHHFEGKVFNPVGGIEAYREMSQAKADTYKAEIVQAAS